MNRSHLASATKRMHGGRFGISISLCLALFLSLFSYLLRSRPLLRSLWGLKTDEFIPHEAIFPFMWIEPEIAKYPKPT